MSQPSPNKRKRTLIFGLATLGVIATLITGTLLYRQRTADSDDFTNPTIQTNNNGSTTSGNFAVEGVAGSGRADTTAAKLLFHLSQGQARAETIEANPLVTGTPLSPDEIAQILARLPELTGATGDTQEFNLPEDILPPPLTGETITQTFPPPPSPLTTPPTADGPLQVLRYTPEGDISLAPFINITFNQPMVPLTSLETLNKEDVPVTITPDLPGTWQWISPQTLRFEFDSDQVDRLPMATEFTADIPAGTQSANGNALAEAVRWTFSTPPVQMVSSYPAYEPQPLEPVIFIAFDQMIEPTAVLPTGVGTPTLRVTANNDNHPVRLATADEIAADEIVSRMADNAREGYWLALKPERPFPPDSQITITIGPNTPSAEGPRLTTEAQTFSFNTYPPLRLTRHTCNWSEDRCPPLTPFILEFSNPLDPAAFAETMIRIEPQLPGARVQLNYNSLTIQGLTAGRTTYRVTIDGSLPDIFGQTLGDSETVRFDVDSAEPFLNGPQEPLITADPSAANPSLTLYVMNYDELHVQAYAVQPSDWPAYTAYRRNFDQQESQPTPPGQLVLDEMLAVEHEEDVLTEIAVNLAEALEGETGHLIVVIQPNVRFSDQWQRRSQTVQAWVQVTQIGLDAFADHSQLVAWATNLADGSPLANVTLTDSNQNTLQTDAAGLAHLDLPASGIQYLIAQQGDDAAILPANPYYWDDYGWQRQSLSDELRWHVFDDRAMYKPGEEVHLKGWLRHIAQDGTISLPGNRVTGISYQTYDAQGNEIATGTSPVNGFGGFDFSFPIPTNSNLGYAYMSLQAQGVSGSLNGREYYHDYQIQEFRRPEFEVSARQESVGPYIVGDAATVAVAASYFAGGPLPNADTNWYVTSTPSSYSPPNWPDFTFGTWTPWWFFDYGYAYEEVYFGGFPGQDGQVAETFSGVTDAAGEHYLQIDFEALEGNRPFTVNAEATVMDVNRQAWSASTNLLVHPASLYVGLRSARTFVEKGEPLDIEAIVTDIDGHAVAGTAVSLTASRLEWNYRDGQWLEEAMDTQTCDLTSTTEPLTCTFTTEQGGEYEITAVITDGQNRQNQSTLTRWVSGGQQPVQRNVQQETLTLIPDRQEYQPGDVAEILVQAPFSPAEGLLTLNHGGIISTEPFQLTDGTATLQIPISESHIPSLSLQVDVVGSAPRTDDDGNALPNVPARPAFATGSLSLSVPPYSRELSLEIVPQADKLEPGEETSITIAVTDANQQPVGNAEVALVVVDEAILGLTNYQLVNPLNIFYTQQYAWINSRYGRSSILLVNPQNLGLETGVEEVEVTRVVTEMAFEAPAEAEMAEESAAFDTAATAMPMPTTAAAGNAATDDGSAPAPIQVRTNFDPLAVFAPTAQTNASGQAQVTFTLPDNLTRYRIMAVAVAGDRQFGAAESNLTARLPLMIRPSAPRFLNFGDQFELPIVVQNQTNEPMTVDIALSVTNLQLTGMSGQRVTVPANDRVEVRFPATTMSAGTARFQAAAVSGDYADAATGELPVYTPATTEAFATYGVLDEGAVAQPFLMPEGVIQGYGGLEIGTSSTALQALTDAVLYLTSHRYDSSEELASRILAVAALRDVLGAFQAEGLPTPEELETAVTRDLETLQGMQNADGGFPIWQRGDESYPFYTVHVAHALAMAQQKGYAVPNNMQASLQSYLRDIESHYPSYYGQQIRWSLSSYALYVRHLAGDTDANKARSLFNDAGLENLSLESLAWLWEVLGDDPVTADIAQFINNRAVETAAAANFTTSYGDEAYLMLHSDRRTDGVILNTLISQDPNNDLIPKIVNGLLAHRTRGHWGNSQEDVFILLALDRYFNTFEAQTPDFVARIWLGDTFAGEQSFVGRSTDRNQLDIPMSYLAEQQVGDLVLGMEGNGRLYYRLALNYAPADLTLDPLNRGFVVQRTYEAVDNPDDVMQDADGVWHIKLGARVRVRLTMVADNRRYNVALVDPLPAGLEAINPALAVSQSLPPDPNSGDTVPYWWWGNWYQHQNMRDERLEAFTTLLWEGVYSYDYVARATTPGTFITPPTKAEEMYSPEVFGRSSSDVVIVE
ncbi:MAG: hypothetical protein H6658_17695 [Ardenticatenaceae bacterium]|nr:hypothetical protein [Ardenticatenaceae bacterium]